MEGWLYACRALTCPLVFKCGFTQHECPEQYCYDSYSRSMPNLQVYITLHVPYARQGEAMLFIALAAYRIDQKHENFQVLTVQAIDDAFQKVIAAFSDLSAKPSGQIAMSREDFSGATDRIVHKLVKSIFQEVTRQNRQIRQKRYGDITVHEKRVVDHRRTVSDTEKVVGAWLLHHFTFTNKREDDACAGMLYNLFQSDNDAHKSINLKQWAQSMICCGVQKTRLSTGCIYWGLKRKVTPKSN